MVRKSCHVGGTDGQLLQAEIATASSIGQVIAFSAKAKGQATQEC